MGLYHMSLCNDSVKVSIIMPLYNVADYLTESLDSIRNQSFQNFEVIMIDDGSTDQTFPICKQFEAVDSRFICCRQDNTGAGAARNRGIELAKGEYLIFLDGDDVFRPDMIEIMSMSLDSSGADVCLVGSTYFDSDSGKRLRKKTYPEGLLGKVEVDTISNELFQIVNGQPWDKMFTKRLLDSCQVRFQNLPNSNDNYFVYTMIARAKSLFFSNEQVVYYRCNTGKSLQDSKAKHPECALESARAIFISLSDYGLYDAFKLSFDSWLLGIFVRSYSSAARCSRDAADLVFSVYRGLIKELYELNNDHPMVIGSKLRVALFCLNRVTSNGLYWALGRERTNLFPEKRYSARYGNYCSYLRLLIAGVFHL